MKIRLIIYAILAMAFQVLLGQLTGQGQGGIGMLTFILIVEIDPKYSFSYLIENNIKPKKEKK